MIYSEISNTKATYFNNKDFEKSE